MNWAKERAQAVVKPLKDRIHKGITPKEYDELWDRVAAELQRVADECAETVDQAPSKGNLADGDTFWRGQQNFANDIRFKFPKEAE